MQDLVACQNRDGGWPYHSGGPSWTEPAAYALLALSANRSAVEPVERALGWLRAAQRPDGGWSPAPGVAQSTWVSAVVVLLGPVLLGDAPYQRAVAWLLHQTGEETSFLTRLRTFMSGNQTPPEQRSPGWPWFPGASAWVTPTALSMLALGKAFRLDPSAAMHRRLQGRLQMGASFLLRHACSDGGWNYGAPRALGFEARSYPETTGIALLALHGIDSSEVRKACSLAQSQLAACHSSEAESWLRLGLLAHGRLPPDAPAPTRPQRTVQNTALALLASAAERGPNIFLE
jgi:Prenyltransferase and squalene oxidase repeat